MTEEREFAIIEVDEEFRQSSELTAVEGDDGADLLTEDTTLDICWSVKVFRICVSRVTSNSVTIDLYLANIKLGSAVLSARRPCISVRHNIGLAKVDAKVCVDFGKREVRATGRVCVTFACVRFNQKIFSW